MAKKENTQSVVIEPNIFAANNPNYGMGRVRNNAPAQSPSASSVAPALDPSSYTFTAEQLGLDTEPAKQTPVNNPTTEFAGTLLDNGTQPKSGSRLGDFFRGLAGRVKPWGGTDASRGDGGTIGYLGSLYTSPAEEAEYRRRSQNKMKLMALADAVRQFGNIYHTSRSAPAQQFDNIYEKERARYLQDKAMRDRDNQYYFQQKAREAQMDMQREKMAEESARRAEELAMKKEINDLRKPIYENQAKEAGYKAEMKGKDAAHYDTALQKKDAYEDARIGAAEARARQSDAAAQASIIKAKAAAANDYDKIRKRVYGGGGGSGKTASGASVPIRFAGNNGSYGKAKAPTKQEIYDLYQDAVSQGFVDKKNQQMVASGEQSMEQVINKVATYTNRAKADDFFKRHGFSKVIAERKPEAKKQVTGKGNAGKGGSRGGNTGNGGGTWSKFSIHNSK